MNNKLSAMFVVLALLLGGAYYVNLNSQNNTAECQSKFNTAFTETLTIRSTLSGQRQDAVDALLTGVTLLVIAPPDTKAEEVESEQAYLKLFRAYDLAVRANDESRAANPLPELPKC